MTRDNERDPRGIFPSAAQFLSVVARRVKSNRLVMWVLFWGRRSVVSVALLGGVFAAFLTMALIRPLDMERLLSDTQTLRTLFSAL